MNIQLTLNETRVIGCLMEKSVTTPDQYPLTLNALTNACNQKSSRSPVLSLDQGAVQQTTRQLADKHLLRIEENFNSRVEKYHQRLCNTPFAEVQFSAEEFALICVLLLRGRQTPGELRTKANRLFEFADNNAVAETLQQLMDRSDGPFVARLPRSSGRQDHEYCHVFSDTVESVEADEARGEPPPRISQAERIAELESRVAVLEQMLSEMRASRD